MLIIQLQERYFESELKLSASRSSGPGGQFVNKVSTRVELRFNIISSEKLSDEEKQLLLNYNSSFLTLSGELLISSQQFRSQARNKDDVIDKFYRYLAKVLTPVKKRKKTKPTKNSIEKRLNSKKRIAEIKKNRGKIHY